MIETVNQFLAGTVLLMFLGWVVCELGWGGVRNENSKAQYGGGSWHDIPRFFKRRRP